MHMPPGALDAPVTTLATECSAREHAPAHACMHIGPLAQCERSSVKPLAPQTFAVRLTIRQDTHDKLRHAQELLSHQLPAHVRCAVWKRDQGQCTFVSEHGRRCSARTRIEFDHIQEVVRGGEATVAGMRLRCRSHNQYGAELAFGAEFMRHKRIAAEVRAAAIAARVRATVAAGTRAAASSANVSPAMGGT